MWKLFFCSPELGSRAKTVEYFEACFYTEKESMAQMLFKAPLKKKKKQTAASSILIAKQ